MENKRKFRLNNDLEYEFRARVKSKLAPGPDLIQGVFVQTPCNRRGGAG